MATSRIRLERASWGYVDWLRSYRVLLDGSEVGRIRHGRSLTLETPPGRHEVRLAIDWCKSQTVTVDL